MDFIHIQMLQAIFWLSRTYTLFIIATLINSIPLLVPRPLVYGMIPLGWSIHF